MVILSGGGDKTKSPNYLYLGLKAPQQTHRVYIPITFNNIHKGAKKIYIDHARLPYYLGLQQSDMNTLQRDELIQPEVPVKNF